MKCSCSYPLDEHDGVLGVGPLAVLGADTQEGSVDIHQDTKRERRLPKAEILYKKYGRIHGHVNSVPYGQQCETIERMWVVDGV